MSQNDGRPDWLAIRTEYESGVPRREICAKYGLSYNTLDSQIRRNRWSKVRETVARKVHEKCTTKIVNEKTEETVSITKDIESAQRKIAKLLNRRLDEYEETNKYSMLDLQRAQETADGLAESPSIQKQETRKNKLVEVLRTSVRKGHGEDVPV